MGLARKRKEGGGGGGGGRWEAEGDEGKFEGSQWRQMSCARHVGVGGGEEGGGGGGGGVGWGVGTPIHTMLSNIPSDKG